MPRLAKERQLRKEKAKEGVGRQHGGRLKTWKTMAFLMRQKHECKSRFISHLSLLKDVACKCNRHAWSLRIIVTYSDVTPHVKMWSQSHMTQQPLVDGLD